MPRTKRPARQQEKQPEGDGTLKSTLEKLAYTLKQDIDRRAQLECTDIEVVFKVFGTISKKYLNKTIGELKSELCLKDSSDTSHNTVSRPASQDDGYLTENSSQSSDGAKRGRFVTPASRSDTSSRKAPPPSSRPRRFSRSVYKTPMNNRNPSAYPPITPKVAPQTPLMVLRQPRQGEMIVSMSGSPVMVPTCYTMQQEDKANCNILLQDGTMLSLQPKQFRKSQAYIPYALMDSDVLTQLQTLKDNLDAIVKNGQKAMS